MTERPQSPYDLTEAVAPGLLRRLGAIFYDSLLLTALVFVATAVVTLPFGYPTGNWLLFFQIFLFEIIPLAFFCWFWLRGGQTLGMRAWRLKLVSMEGLPVDWEQALKRHFAAILSLLVFGFGFFWVVFDSDNLAWHDRLSGTRLILTKN
ncbi:MAG: RDD family protein [Candidatus Thiodiazotropha lotti]|uniref:RDD family protein n=1 Tax=Candidatus Thiodiazotropha lotti TaxID=2792787 RepID=A0A9E4K3K6_9GAMM|nr:RDD family protein [Candidatus Thiodiazotropha lotti]ODB99385.1 transporter [Candidatus Thiodiazotropha endoloripes]MCG7920332.1 RDD family protein [Candidatus Thiodiazotropha lotti]MCG7931068.1 RDD family protein [Candidatus Thiodiazotropha lotti]MCG7938587.1 RDD family protein [Candidatus Thiodiazotropha lotti]